MEYTINLFDYFDNRNYEDYKELCEYMLLNRLLNN